MPITTLEFVDLEEKIRKTKKSVFDLLAPELGKAYVIAVTRDGCPVCVKQKPKLNKLAQKLREKHGEKVGFTRVHIRYAQDFTEESLRSKDVFHHYFYPTNLILVRTRDRGPFEYYRNAAPRVSELERNIESALGTAIMLEKEG